LNTRLSECIAPDFRAVHTHVKNEEYTEYWFRGGRGSTKSSFISIEIILELLKDPQANVVVFRRYENEVRDSVFGQLTWAINKLGVEGSFKFQVSPFKIIYVPTGQQIIFKGADNPLKIKSINLGRGYIKHAWFEEVDQFGGMEEIRNILQSIFRGTDEKQIAFFSYNPPKSARSWVNAETRVEKSGRFVHYSDYRTVDPSWLGTTFLTNAEHLRKTNFDAYRHEYLGEEIGTGLEVFSNVTLRAIPDGEIQYFDNYYQGLDFGYAADPLAFTQSHFDSKRRILYIFFEIVEVGLKNSVFADKLNDEQKHELTMADGAEPKSIAELKEDYGLNIMGAKKGPGSVDHGIKWLQDLEEIVIDPERCPHAAKEFTNYALQTNREGEVISKYPDKENHCFVGDTMISTALGPKRIDEIRVGELVLTRKGLKPVTKVFNNGYKEVVTTKLLNGKSLTLTDTHEIITRAGDVRFKDLMSSDFVYYEVDGCRFIETENRKLQYLKERSIDVTQRAKDVLTGCISKDLKRWEIGISISQYMKLKLEKYQRVITSITWMVTHSIILFLIWLVLKAQSICRWRQGHIIKPIKKLLRRISIISDTSQKSGMQVKKGDSGIPTMVNKLGRRESLFPSPVSIAERLIRQSIWGSHDFVPINVSQLGVENQVLMTWDEAVGTAEACLWSTNTQSSSSVPENVQMVYDIEVEGAHEYFANGLLVHNCIDSTRYGCVRLISNARIEKYKGKYKANPIPVVSRW
jgi:PBSX family phage terminase large subunit